MSLSFTHVITETLWLGNIIGGIMHKAVRGVEVNGYLIPKGWCDRSTSMICSTMSPTSSTHEGRRRRT
ncbi:hypothetical protein DAI22_07g026200 [Oryza sativa Japonica Group]|nr:hypothetical protein DAI22_07g026200 [Oryza sativa Japonica Group]